MTFDFIVIFVEFCALFVEFGKPIVEFGVSTGQSDCIVAEFKKKIQLLYLMLRDQSLLLNSV